MSYHHLIRGWIGTAAIICLCVGSCLAEEEHLCRFLGATEHGLPFGTELEGSGRRYAPDRLVDIQHIQLEVTPDFRRRTVTGTATITCSAISSSVATLRLDAVHLSVRDVRCDDHATEFASTSSQLDITFDPALQPGEQIQVAIDYSAQPERGLYFRTSEMGYPVGDDHIWTQGETHEARHWFPCFDYPNERSTTEVICHVPKEMLVLSNGRLVSESESDQTGLKRVHWLQDQPHASYLICLVAGYFSKLEKQHRDIPLGFYTQPSLAEHAANSFQDTDAIMAFFESEIGVPFPWHKYDQVTIRDFVAGGMENTTLTTLTHRTIFSTATENLRSTRSLDAHEMAHQWFGDYVTCKDWSHLWLNEGFATYYAHLYEGHKFGRDALLYGLYLDANRRILIDRGEPRPIVFNAYQDPGEQFDYRAYPKGSWVLHMLRSQLGEDLYRRSIKAYLQRHALQSVISDDLRQVFEEMSGRPLDRFFDQWVYHGGHPELNIRFSWLPDSRLAKITVKQTQQVDDDVSLFHLPTSMRFVVGGEPVDFPLVVDRQQQDFYFPLAEKPSVVRFDPHYTLLAKIDFEKSDDMLLAQSKRDDDMIGRLLAAEAMSQRKTHQSVQRLRQMLREDSFFGVRVAASRSLRVIRTDEAYQALVDSYPQDDARVRAQVLRDVAAFYRPNTFQLLEQVLQEEKNPAIVADAVQALGQYPRRDTRPMILKYLRSESFRHELADAAVAAIESQLDPTFREPLLRALRSDESKFSSAGFGNALIALARISSELDEKDDIRSFLESFLNDRRQAVQLRAIRALGELQADDAVPLLEAFALEDDPADRVASAARSALRRIRERAPLVPAEVVELRKLIDELKRENVQLRKDVDDLKAQVDAERKQKAE